MDLVAQAGEHPSDLPVLALVEHHLQNGALLVLGANLDPLGMHAALGQPHSPSETVKHLGPRHTGYLHVIFLLDAIPRMGQKVGQFAIVGDEDQALAHPVKPADCKEPCVAGHKIDHPRATGGIVIGGDGSDRLVEHVDNPLRVRQPLTVDTDLLPQGIDAGAEFRNHFSINLDAALCDQFLATAAAAETG